MVTGNGWRQAVAYTKKHPNLATGLHLDLTEKKGLWTTFFKLILSSKARLIAKNEIRRQYKKLKNTGIEITHIDSHEHIHILPFLYREVAALARENGIRQIRHCKYSKRVIKSLFSTQYSLKRAIILMLYMYCDRFIDDTNWDRKISLIDDPLWKRVKSKKLTSYNVEEILHYHGE